MSSNRQQRTQAFQAEVECVKPPAWADTNTYMVKIRAKTIIASQVILNRAYHRVIVVVAQTYAR